VAKCKEDGTVVEKCGGYPGWVVLASCPENAGSFGEFSYEVTIGRAPEKMGGDGTKYTYNRIRPTYNVYE